MTNSERQLQTLSDFFGLRCAPGFMRLQFTGVPPHGDFVENDQVSKRGEANLFSGPLTYKQQHGIPGDYNDQLPGYCFGVCSEEFIQAMYDAKITGFTSRPATVMLGSGTLGCYHALIVSGRAKYQIGKHMRIVRRKVEKRAAFPVIPPNISRSEVERIHAQWLSSGITGEEDYHLGFYFDINTWDGSDFFTDSKPSDILLCSRRVKEVVAESGLTGCLFQPVPDWDWGVPNPFFQ